MKKVLLAGFASLAGAASLCAADVTSINAVGYANVAVPPGFSMVANPLSAATSTVSALFAGAPTGTQIFKYNGTTFDTAFHLGGGTWINGSLTLTPGEGVFVRNTTASSFNVTFVGEVLTGTLQNSIPAGFSIRSSQVPQSGAISTLLGLPVAAGDQIYIFNNAGNNYQTAFYLGGVWVPSEPTVQVGQSFWVFKSSPATWTRNFAINN